MSEPLAHADAGEFRGIIGVARADITPPPGIHARCWGAATHDVADGVHQPLTLTTITFQRARDDTPLVLMSADLMSWRSRAAETAVIGEILAQSRLPRERLMFCLTHTHASPSIRSDDRDKPGGDLIEPYQKQIVSAALRCLREAQVAKVPATLTWRYGRCDLATNRDLPDPTRNRIVCGFNPSGEADDTLLVGRVCDDAGKIVATIVNYACHPTTLAWENRLISPDWIGAMRQTIEAQTRAPCLFLQAASGELAPAEQYVSDPEVAERHGRRVGFAALAVLEAMDAPGERLTYQGVVESGAPLAIWKPRKVAVRDALEACMTEVELPLKQMPTVEQTEFQLQQSVDPIQKERLARQRALRAIVGDGVATRTPLFAWRLGDGILVGQPNEAYSKFQRELRRDVSPMPAAVINLVNGSVGYLAPRDCYRKEIYQVWQSPFAEGSLEILIREAQALVSRLK